VFLLGACRITIDSARKPIPIPGGGQSEASPRLPAGAVELSMRRTSVTVLLQAAIPAISPATESTHSADRG